MSNNQSGFNSDIHETASGQSAIVAALVMALHENGVLPQDKYVEALHRLWIAMPEEAAIGESGAIIERLLELLDATASSFHHSGNIDQQRETPVLAGASDVKALVADCSKNDTPIDHDGFTQSLLTAVET